MDKHVDIIKDRIIGIENDLKTFIDLRKSNRQHENNEYSDNLGGGNMVMALALFASLGLLGKAYVCVNSNEKGELEKYFTERGHASDEQKIFVELMQLISGSVKLFEAGNPSKRTYKSVWEYFRDFTTHVLVPDQGNSVETCIWSETQDKSAGQVLDEIRLDQNLVVFRKNDDGSWIVNIDKLLAVLPEITMITTKWLQEHKNLCSKNCDDVLQRVLWR